MFRHFTRPLRLILLTVLLFLGVTHFLPAADWPNWRGPRHDGVSHETGLLQTWPAAGPKVLWQAPMGKGYSSVAVAGGKVFTQLQNQTDLWTLALDEQTGKELWRTRLGAAFLSKDWAGTRSTPTVAGDHVYVTEPQGGVFCLSSTDGRILWQRNIIADYQAKLPANGVCISPLVDDGKVLLMSGQSAGYCALALDKLTGQTLWHNLNDLGGYATPVAATIGGAAQYVFFTGDAAVGLAQDDGKELWRFPWKCKFDNNLASPLVLGDHVFVATNYGVGCARAKIDLNETTPTQIVFKNKNMRTLYCSPVLVDGYVYGMDEDHLTCLNWETGARMWKAVGSHRVLFAYAAGLAVLLDEKGLLTLARLTPQKYEKLDENATLLKGQTLTTPVIANGKLYVRDEEKLLCLDLKAGG